MAAVPVLDPLSVLQMQASVCSGVNGAEFFFSFWSIT
jgi:hypothetical protein